MAFLSAEYESNLKPFMIQMRKAFPALMVKMMGYIGSRGQELLKRKFLSGQEINLTGGAYALDRKGRRKISHWVLNRGIAVKITSYPAFLFEDAVYGRGKEIAPGKKIIRSKFKIAMLASVQGMADDYDKKFLEKEMKRLDR